MSEQALIDGLKFAENGQQLAGEVAVGAMPRLQDSVFEPTGRVLYRLTGMTDRRRRPIIEVMVHGTIPLVCQRCLGRLDYALERRSRLVLVANADELPDVAQEAPDTETMPAPEVGNVADLVEQEVLLGLPLAPVHAEPCAAPLGDSTAKVESPFAVLSTLKRT
jgi:uncharacterized protein